MSYKLIGYFENWAQYSKEKGKFLPENINPSLFTHVNYAFAFFGFQTSTRQLTGDYKVYPVEWNDQTVLYPGIQKLKRQAPALKTSLSIGGWSFNDPNDHMGYGSKTFHPMAARLREYRGKGLTRNLVVRESQALQLVYPAFSLITKYRTKYRVES